MQKSKQTMMVALVAGLMAVAPLTAGAQDEHTAESLAERMSMTSTSRLRSDDT